MDTASLHEWRWNTHGIFRPPTCDDNETALGYGTQEAAARASDDSEAHYGNSRPDNPGASAKASGNTWKYSGLPTFYDLSTPALAYLATSPNPGLKFSIRLTRDKHQTKTSDGTSAVKLSGKLANFEGKTASDVLATVATSEVFFQRPVARSDGKTELASLFNPYWQVHLIPTTSADIATAFARGGPL